MSSTNRQIPPLREIYLYLTGSCNLNCRHCWINPVFEDKTDKFLPWSDLKKIIEGAIPLGLQRIKITGGEPFMHPEIIQILHSLKEMNLGVRLETNGTLIGEKEARALKENAISFSVSLDGPTAEIHDNLRGVKGAFDKTIQGLEYIKKEDMTYEIITCLYSKNKDCLPLMITFAEQMGAGRLKINPVSGMARSEKMKKQGEILSVDELLEIRRNLSENTRPGSPVRVIFDIPPVFKSLKEIREQGFNTCGILNILGVLHSGRGGLCGIGESVEELDFGDLTSLSIKDIWGKNPVLNEIREGLPGNLTGICGRCLFKNYCLGKCVAQNYYEKGSLMSGFSLCEEAFGKGLFPASRLIDCDSRGEIG